MARRTERYTEFEKIFIEDFMRNRERPLYCVICGKPIIRTTENADFYEEEVKNKAHITCIREYHARQLEKQMKGENA